MKRQAGYKKAQALIELANQAVGSQQAHEAYKLHLEQLLEEFDLATAQLERVEEEVKQVLADISFAEKLRTIKGLSAVSLAGIIGGSGRPEQFYLWQLSVATCGLTSGRSEFRKMERANYPFQTWKVPPAPISVLSDHELCGQ